MAPFQDSPLEAAALTARGPPPPVDVNENTQARQYQTVIVILCIVPPFVILRFVSRRMHRMPLSWDDFSLVIACILAYGSAAMVFASLHYGMGKHAAALTPDQLSQTIKCIYIFDIFDVWTLLFLKCSVLYLFRRIFPTKAMKWGIYIVSIMVVGWFVPTFIVGVLQCNPPRKQWMPLVPGSCVNSRAYLLGGGVAHFVTDLFILALPVKPILDLHVSHGRKVLIAIAFLSGTFTAAVSVYRLVVQTEVSQQDMTYSIADAMSWCVVEVCTGVISCCLPTLMPVINYCLSRSHLGQKLLKTNFMTHGSNSGADRRTKGSTTDPHDDDFEQPLTTAAASSFHGRDVSADGDYSWETHRPKEAGGEGRGGGGAPAGYQNDYSASISKSPNVQQQSVFDDPRNVELDDLRAIRVMQEVDIIDHKA